MIWVLNDETKMLSRISSNKSIISSRWWQLKYFWIFLNPPTRVKTVSHEVVVEGIDIWVLIDAKS